MLRATESGTKVGNIHTIEQHILAEPKKKLGK